MRKEVDSIFLIAVSTLICGVYMIWNDITISGIDGLTQNYKVTSGYTYLFFSCILFWVAYYNLKPNSRLKKRVDFLINIFLFIPRLLIKFIKNRF
ncbi:hypothetical protein PEPS_10410 [Persicobacter psychrovividus]|uniref:Uncharacterized protein n=1 Tax=Persicobacter psychrovividus TaxID=387638 RepID=A0ABM7VCU1_9BACT|nr:hypothetical protein PEPS_10410 [Persicobacter psychrovividus]